MNGKFERELRHIQTEYEKSLGIVRGLGSNLKKLFNDKSTKIKENCTQFFIKIDT